jgi:hypothetical protein
MPYTCSCRQGRKNQKEGLFTNQTLGLTLALVDKEEKTRRRAYLPTRHYLTLALVDNFKINENHINNWN